VAAAGDGELTGDGGEEHFDFIAEPNEDGDGDDGNEGEDEGILDQGLAVPFAAMFLEPSLHGCNIVSLCKIFSIKFSA
jgi:hypothetical protein